MCSCFVKKLLNKFTEAIKGLSLLIGSRLYCNLKTFRRLFQNNRVIVSWVLQTNHYVLALSPHGVLKEIREREKYLPQVRK